MSKNLIPKICKMLGVELGEEFKAKSVNRGITDERVFVLSEDGGFYKDKKTQAYVICPEILSRLVCGHFEIVKLPWKPKMYEQYWTFDKLGQKWIAVCSSWEKCPYEILLFDKGWVYRTKEEAAAALPKVAAEMGVDYAI